ncbi:hypothetical protein BDV26DRAFT_251088 [Aspergillus bertholletiae]|uniref:Uncharacterized protein n=1 Tax=Aspergillus bertholletiae TaxID=1226010 RepID=A0A5N7BP08_9EURO|nr:hypothetical protein BDV26DRAFT_251088 [Aspergillus bertholletiae]
MTIRAESSQRRLSWSADRDQSGRDDKGPGQMRSITRENMVGDGSHYSLSGWSMTCITLTPSKPLLIFRSLDDEHPLEHD